MQEFTVGVWDVVPEIGAWTTEEDCVEFGTFGEGGGWLDFEAAHQAYGVHCWGDVVEVDVDALVNQFVCDEAIAVDVAEHGFGSGDEEVDGTGDVQELEVVEDDTELEGSHFLDLSVFRRSVNEGSCENVLDIN